MRFSQAIVIQIAASNLRCQSKTRAVFLGKYLDVYETGADVSVASECIVPHHRSNLHPDASPIRLREMQRNVSFATSLGLSMIVMKQKVTITRTDAGATTAVSSSGYEWSKSYTS
jgi:hypothetical protein